MDIVEKETSADNKLAEMADSVVEVSEKVMDENSLGTSMESHPFVHFTFADHV